MKIRPGLVLGRRPLFLVTRFHMQTFDASLLRITADFMALDASHHGTRDDSFSPEGSDGGDLVVLSTSDGRVATPMRRSLCAE